MIIEKVKVSDYNRICREHKIFLWHFLEKDHCSDCYNLFSYFDKTSVPGKNHKLKEIVDLTQIPYFESSTEDSFDFLIQNGIRQEAIWSFKRRMFRPIVVGFKNGVIASHTAKFCYCEEGLLEVIAEIDLKLLENIV